MSDTKFVKIIIKACVLELGDVVSSDVHDLETIIRHGPIEESFEDILHFSLEGDDMHPGVTRIVINNNKAI